MAKFRTSHQRERHSLFSAGFKIVLALLILVILFFTTKPFVAKLFENQEISDESSMQESFYLPALDGDEWVGTSSHFTYAYQESFEQAKWVAYTLTLEQLNAPRVPRTDYFSVDPRIKSGSATYEDYRGSGYSRGHLVPAADRAYSSAAMDATFLMSNISPQRTGFNAGVWRELEENVRDWARKRGEVIIICGPVIEPRPKRFGQNSVAIPSHFFKVVLDVNSSPIQGIGFVLPNEKSDEPLDMYMMSIDAVEAITDIDFFHELLSSAVEAEVESTLDKDVWPIDQRRFRKRLEDWNHR